MAYGKKESKSQKSEKYGENSVKCLSPELIRKVEAKMKEGYNFKHALALVSPPDISNNKR